MDLRDGNQALLDPMDLTRKRMMFELLVRLGFKEIEVGFPTSSQTDWDFVRELAHTDTVPEDVLVQVMSPMRRDLIERTVRSLAGLPRAVLQVFNPTSPAQRRVVFGASRDEIKAMALAGAEIALRLRDAAPSTTMALQYAPESFTQTEPEFALEVCNAVLELWQPRPGDDIRINLPATVEAFPPAEFGDRIEWMSRHLAYRDVVTLSVHPHNDRGTGVAAAEAAVLAGAQRVEGTLFGNGERSGNVCLITLAMNLFSQGVDPLLDLSDIDDIKRIVEKCNGMPVSARHPWGGELVYTSLAGAHQDAISKALADREGRPDAVWDVPYLPIDPHDVGRDYHALIRVSNQSGKGGIAYLMRTEYGLELPRPVQIALSAAVQAHTDAHGGEITPDLLWHLFVKEFVRGARSAAGAVLPETDDPGDLLLALMGSDAPPTRCVDLIVHPLPEAGDPQGHFCGYAQVIRAGRSAWGVGFGETEKAAAAAAMGSAFERAVRPTASADQKPVDAA